MGLPILNMDGYLLRQIKAETARANAADAQLQNQITALAQGAIVGATANTANGWRMIDADELIYWTGSASTGSYPVVPTPSYSGVDKVGGFTVWKSAATIGYGAALPWNETEFNKGKPYLAVIGYQFAAGVTGSVFKAGVDIEQMAAASGVAQSSFLPSYHHEQRYVTNFGLGLCDVLAFSPPILVDRSGLAIPYGFKMFIEQFVDGAATDVTVKCYNPYDLYDVREDGVGLNLYVNFAKEE